MPKKYMTARLARTNSSNPPLKPRSSWWNSLVPVSGNKATGKTVVVGPGVVTKTGVAVGVVEDGGA